MGKKLLFSFFFIFILSPALIWGQCPSSVSISSDTGNTICDGTAVTFTASANGGTGTLSYQWQINGVNQGDSSTDNTFMSATLANGEKVKVIVTSSDSATCSTPSSQITMTVNSNKTPTVSISSSPSLKCIGETVTFTASNTNAGSSPQYEWFVNSETSASQTSSSNTFSTSGLPAGANSVKVVLTSSLTCVTSDTAEATANITISDDATIDTPGNKDQSDICINSAIDPIIFSIGGSGNGASVSGLPAGVSGNFSGGNFTISGAPTSAGTFPYTVTATGSCESVTATGSLTVVKDASISLTSSNNQQEVCQDEDISTIQYNIGETGTGATITGLPSGFFGNFSGGVYSITGSSPDIGIHNYSITATGTCGDSETLTGSITINENLTLSVSITSSDADNSICEGTSVTFTATPTNEGANPSYQWKVGTTNVGNGSDTFTTNSLAIGDQSVSVVLTSDETCLAQATATSNSIVTTVNENLTPDVTVTPSDTDICEGDNITFTATPVNGGTSPSYQWKVDGNNVGTNSPTFSTASLTNGQSVTVVLTSNETCLATPTATSAAITTTVNPNLTPQVSITSDDPNNIICSGSSITFTATPVNGGTSPTYQWYVDGNPTGSGGPSFSTASLTNGQTVKVIMTSAEECLAQTTAESNEITIQVDNSVSGTTPEFDTTDPTHNPTAVCPVASGLIYKVKPIAGATSYNWTFPSGWNITSGAGTNQVTVTAATSAQSGNIQVTALNECGSSVQFVSENVSIGTVVYVSAGPDQTVCKGTAQVTLAGEIGGVITKHQDWDWSANVSGGSFSNGGNSLTGTYSLPSNISNNGGTIIIKITSIDPAGPCGIKTDEMTITVLQNATLSDPSNKNQTICINTSINPIAFNVGNAGTGATASNLPTGLTGNFNSGIFTISGTPTQAGTFNYTVNTTGNCTSQQVSRTGTITVTPDNTIDDPQNKDQEICINTALAPIVFTVNSSVTGANITGLPAGISGNFSNGTVTISGTPTEAGTFNYTVNTTGNCAITSQNGIITVKPDATIDSPVNKDQEICINTAIAPIEFSITDPGSGASTNGLPNGISGIFSNGKFTLSGSPTVAGTFDYTITTTGDCIQAVQNGQLIVNPDPTAQIEYTGEFCTSQSNSVNVNLTGTGAYSGGTFYATPAGLTLDSSTGAITPGSSTPGTYTVNYDTPEGCQTATATTSVVINELPSVEISYNTPLCNSDGTAYAVEFSNGKGIYENGTFSSTPGGLNIDSNTGNINPQSSSPGTYTIFYTIPASAGCDEVIVQTEITITQLPQVSISYATPLCNSDNTLYSVIYSSTAGDYSGGTFSGTEGLDIATNGDINPQNSTPGLHTVTYNKDTTDDGCPLVEATTDIEIFEKVQITTQPENYGTCSSNPASFEVIATGDNLTYQWYKKDSGGTFVQINGETNPTLSFNNATSVNAGEYHVVVGSSNGVCASVTSDPVTLNIDEEIVITKPAEDVIICEDDYETLSFEYEAHASGAELSFQWIKDGNPINDDDVKYDMTRSGPTGPEGIYTGTLTILNIDLNDDGVYAVEIDGPDYFTCPEATSKTFTFRVNPRPAAPGITHIEYCLNDTPVALTADKASPDNELLWYSYDDTTGDYTYLGTSITPATDIDGTTSYWVTQRQPNGCESDPEELIVTVFDKPDPVATETIEFNYCFNEEVTDPISVSPADGSTINWYDTADATTALASAPTPNTSQAQVTSFWVSQTLTSTGCESERTKVDIIINPLPEIIISIADGFASEICLGSDTKLIASGATSYVWSFNGTEIGTDNEITITADNVGTFEYEVTGTDDNGCINTNVISISVEEPSAGGTISGPSSVCVTQNQGTLSLADYNGEIQRWESSTDGVNWTIISETTDTLNFQDLSGTTTFRTIVKNGVCEEVASTSISISIDPEPIAGGVMFNGTDRVFMMCEFPTDDYLVPLQTTGNYVGEVIAWQYRRNSQTDWNTIIDGSEPFTGTTLTGQQVNAAANNESTLFRVEVQSGACSPNVYSDYATLSIIPSDIAPNPVTANPGVICIGDFVTLNAGTGYGGSGTFEGGAFDNSSIANHGWRVMRYPGNTEYTFESAADNVRPDRWMRTNPHDFIMANPNGSGTIYQRFDSCSCDEGNKGFAIVSGDNPSTLETPVFNLYATENPTLTFDQAYNLTAGDTIKVQISMDGGNTYIDEPLFVVGGPILSGNYDRFGDDGLGEPNNMEIDLSQYAGLGNLRIRWLYDGSTGGIYTIDDIGLPEDPQNVQLIWYYDDDLNNPDNPLDQIGEVNQNTVTYTPTKIGWNYFQVNTALVFDTNGDPCESAENQATIQVYVFDSYTTTATADVGTCGSAEVPLQGTLTGGTQGEITGFPVDDESAIAWSVISGPDGYNFSESHFTTSGTGPAINDPQAIFNPPLEGTYTLSWAVTKDEDNPCEVVNGEVTFDFVECTTLDFDGVDDYIDLGTTYTGNYFIEAWIRPEEPTGTIISGPGFDIKMENMPASIVPNTRWYHIAVSNNGALWVDGISMANITITGNGANKTIIGARWNSNDKTTENHFSGWIEEVRIWNNPPELREIRFMMNQRLKLDGTGTVTSPLEGEVVPNRSVAGSYLTDGGGNNLHLEGDGTLKPFYDQIAGDLAGYYRLISDNPDPAGLITFDPALQPSGGYTPDHAINKIPGRLYNITTDQENTSPTPYLSGADGTWATDATWARPVVWDPPNGNGINSTPIEWNIARINHNIESSSKNITMLGLLSETLDKRLNINPSQFIRISHYLLLDGNMDLQGESQLLQDHGSILANESQGWAEIDQQGRMSSFNYNYWTSPVSNQGTNNNSGYMLNQVLLDGTTSANPQPVNFQNGYFIADGAKTNPITISNEWIWDFRGGTADIYGDWTHLGSDYTEIVGAGYSMKGTTGNAGLSDMQNYVFRGKPNNGNIPTTELYLTNNKNYLVGNPYPSAIDADKFLRDNLINVATGTGDNENGENVFNGTLYYWDHFAGSTHILEEYIGGYATYTLAGSAPAISNDWRINEGGGSNNILPEQYIPVAQGFFLNSAPVGSTTFGGEIIFKNTQRAFKKESSDPSIFLQHEDDLLKGQTFKNSEDKREKIRLKFESPKGYHRQILVTRDENTTNGFDVGYDAPLIEDNYEDMYWWFEENGFVIQGVPDFDKEQVLPLAIKTRIEGQFTIKIDSTENWPTGKELYLKDKLNDSIHDIIKQKYVGTATPGEIKDRFELVFFKEKIQDPLNPELPILEGIGISYSHFSRKVKISNENLLNVSRVMIFDMGGKLIQEYEGLPTEREILLGMRPVRSGIYIVKVFSENAVTDKKIIIK